MEIHQVLPVLYIFSRVLIIISSSVKFCSKTTTPVEIELLEIKKATEKNLKINENTS